MVTLNLRGRLVKARLSRIRLVKARAVGSVGRDQHGNVVYRSLQFTLGLCSRRRVAAGRGGHGTEGGDGLEEPLAVAERQTELFEVALVQLWQNIALDRVLAERRLVLGQPEAPQPIADIHGGPRFKPASSSFRGRRSVHRMRLNGRFGA